jgi:Tfp pilus assembly protein PilF
MNGEASGYLANLQRGIFLRGQKRYKEANEFLGKAIEADPEKATAYAEIALCLNDWGSREREALRAIDRAISLEPLNARYLGLKGWILVCQRKYQGALQTANRGVEMDPVCITALNAQANAYTKLGKWKQAETASRRILALNVYDAPALNLLAQSLRFQGRGKESREVVSRILALLPNNAFGHMNAGYGAMEVGDHLRANEHFLISLRMDPHSDLARKGLLHSLRARVWIYRLQFRIGAFLRRPATFLRVTSLAAIVAGMIPLGFFLEWCHAGLGSLIVVVLVGYIYLSFFSRLTGDIFLFFDPVGRHALTLRDKIHACLFALLLSFLIVVSALAQLWGALATLLVYVGLFGFSIYYPRIKDWLRRRREDNSPTDAV